MAKLNPNRLLNSNGRVPSGFPEIRVLSLVISLVLFTAFLLARLGTNDNMNLLPLALSISILLLPDAFQKFWNINIALLQILVIGFFFILGWISILNQFNISLLIYATCIASLISFFSWSSFAVNRMLFYKAIIFICIAINLVTAVWVQDYMNPLSPEAFTIGMGFGHVDTLYLAAITSNIKTYSVASLGLFGLEPIQYHLGSNYLFASYSQLCELSVMQFYNVGFPIIFVPLFCQSLFYAATSYTKHSIILFSSFAALYLILNGFIPREAGAQYLLPSVLNHHFVSQSYCVSLIYTFLAIAIYSPLLKKSQLHDNPVLNAAFILMIPLWLFIIGYTKVSSGVMLFAVFLYLIVRRGLVFQKWVFISALLSAIVIYWVVNATIESNVSSSAINIGSYYKTFMKGNVFIYFVLNYCWLLFLFIIIFLINRKNITGIFVELTNAKRIVIKVIIDRTGIIGQWIAGKYILVEIIIVCAVAGILPGLLIHIDGGSAYYFSDVQHWLTAIALISLAPFLVKKYHRMRKLWMVVLFFVIMMASAQALISTYLFVKKNIQIKTALAFGKDETFKKKVSVSNLGTLMNNLTLGLKSSNYYREFTTQGNIALLDSLQRLPQDIKRTSLIYCEDPEHMESFLKCGEATFYLPALSEMAMINGTKWVKSCYNISAYGMSQYYSFPTELKKEEAFKIAGKMGFENVIIVNLKRSNHHIKRL